MPISGISNPVVTVTPASSTPPPAREIVTSSRYYWKAADQTSQLALGFANCGCRSRGRTQANFSSRIPVLVRDKATGHPPPPLTYPTEILQEIERELARLDAARSPEKARNTPHIKTDKQRWRN